MQDFVSDVLVSLATGSVAGALVIWLGGKWLGTRIENAIKFEYDQLKVEYESQVRRRERAQLVAELLSEWLSSPTDGPMTPEKRLKLNRLSFEATLWLPEEISRDLSKCLQHNPAAGNIFDLLLKTRAHLSGQHSLTTKDITQWDSTREMPNRDLPAGEENGRVRVVSVELELNGETRPVSEDELAAGFAVPSGGEIQMMFPKRGQKQVTAKTGSIEWLKLVEKRAREGEPAELKLDVFPKDFANALTRSILGKYSDKPLLDTD